LQNELSIVPNSGFPALSLAVCVIAGSLWDTQFKISFAANLKSIIDVKVEAEKRSLRSLLNIFGRCSRILKNLERVAPGFASHSAWVLKEKAAREDHLSFACRIGVSEKEAQRALETAALCIQRRLISSRRAPN